MFPTLRFACFVCIRYGLDQALVHAQGVETIFSLELLQVRKQAGEDLYEELQCIHDRFSTLMPEE